MVKLETGETFLEPISTISSDDPIRYDLYSDDNIFLKGEGRRCLKLIEKYQKKILNLVN